MRNTIPIDSLSRREQIVLQWLIEGLRDKDIAPLLGLTARSVARVVQEICDKLNARTQAACIFLSEQKVRIDWEIENPATARSVWAADADYAAARSFSGIETPFAGVADVRYWP